MDHFEAKFQVEGLHFPPKSMEYGPLDKGMGILQLCRWKCSHKKLCSRLYSIGSWILFFKSLSEPPYRGLRGNVRTSSSSESPWSTFYRHNWTLFAISYCWDVISGNLSTSACFEGDGSHWAQISEGWGVAHQPLLVSEN